MGDSVQILLVFMDKAFYPLGLLTTFDSLAYILAAVSP